MNTGLPLLTSLGVTIGVQTPTCLAVDPDRPSTLYANLGSVYASTDAGASWQKRTAALPWPVSHTLCGGSVAVDPSRPGTAYRADITVLDSTVQGFAVLIRRTTDEGVTWNLLGNGLSGQCGSTLAIDATGRFLHVGTQNTSPCPLAKAAAGVFDFEITRPPDPRNRVVPVVLDVTTASAHYTTELTLTNDTAEDRPVELVYTAALGSREGSGSVSDRLAAGEQRRIPDVLGYLRSKGLALPDPSTEWSQGGTLQVVAPEPAEGSGRFAVLARTASGTAAPLPSGRAGLAYGTMQTPPGFRALRVYGLRSDDADRSNLAVVNTSGDPMSFRVTVFSGSGDGTSAVVADGQTLPPYGWTQINSPDLLDRVGIANGWALVERTSGPGGLNAYGVVNDRVTNDGSFLSPVYASGAGIVPILVETASFRSELVLANRSDADTRLDLSYVESLSPESGTGGTVSVTLPARTQWIVPEAVEFLRRKGMAIGATGPGHAGSLEVFARGPTADAVYAGARTAGGGFGLFTPGVDHVATGRAFVYGLVADARNRSNVAVLNAGSETKYSPRVWLRLQVHDGDAGGTARGEAFEATLDPGQWKQFDDILERAGVTNGWVEITGDGSWIAYGVVNDGRAPGDRTGDGAYVPMTP
jgi:hypothetical protein